MKIIFTRLNKTAIISFSIAVISVIVGLGINIIYAAWTAPSDNPPAGNIAAPINISGADQYKVGGLRLGSAALPGAYQLYVEGDIFSEGSIVPGSADNYSLGSGTYSSSNPWNQLWLKSDVGSTFTNGIHFENSPNNVGITFDRVSHTFNFIKGEAGASTVVGSISHLGDYWAKNSITAEGGMNIDSNTLVVDPLTNRVGIGTATPSYALDIESGDLNVVNGKVVIGLATIPSENSTVYVGSSASPITTPNAIEAYSNGTGSTIYGVNSGSHWGAGVMGNGTAGTHGVRGDAQSGSKAGVMGYNFNHSTGPYFAPGVFGKNKKIFGSAIIYDHAKATGVLGEGPDTNSARGYIDTFGVYAKAGTASANSSADHINSYGLYAIEGAKINGGVSYAGYFDGDVHVQGNLTVDGGFLKIDSVSVVPGATDCDEATEIGRMVLDSTNNLLYICDDTGWKSVSI